MDREYWDQEREDLYEDEEDFYDEQPESSSYIRVNGMNHAVEIGSPFKESVQALAREGGLGKFRVMMNGREVLKSGAPELFTEGMRVELRPYDVAG